MVSNDQIISQLYSNCLNLLCAAALASGMLQRTLIYTENKMESKPNKQTYDHKQQVEISFLMNF